MDYHEFKDSVQWRSWLETHHSAEKAAWVRIYKTRYHEHGLSLGEAVDEALCYGWIDSTLNTLDERSYLLRFTPRRKKSIWSVRNIERVHHLMGEKRMKKSGQAAVNEGRLNGQWDAAREREQVEEIPPELYKLLRRRKGALAAYRSLPSSKKKQYIYWLQSAKQPETRKRRLERIISELSM